MTVTARAPAVAPSALDSAFGGWLRLLGPERAHRDARALRAASRATFATSGTVLAILEPASREEVQGCVKIANQYGVPLYPVSTGKNWGYGSRAPVRDAALLYLGRMNRIVGFDEDLGYVTIEPGVTQRQLLEFLREHGSRLWMDATGASPECSIIGNTMERGFGHTPMGDHCGTACGLEVVLPTGELLQTGFGRFEGAHTAALGRWGVGPSLDGLFSQSNLGIVTRMSVWLMPAPEAFEAFFFTCATAEGLAPVIEAIRPLRMEGTLRSVMHIGNDYKVVAASGRYPWEEVEGRTPLGREEMTRLRSALGVGAWSGSGGLYGTPAHVKEAKRRLRHALAGKVDRIQFVNDRTLGILRRFPKAIGRLMRIDVAKTLAVLDPVYSLLKGVPTASPLASAYWRKKGGPPAMDLDPDRDGCGLLWCSPVLPNTGAAAAEVTTLASRVLLEHGFEPQMSISVATERMLVCVITISYDRDVAGEDERASACYRRLVQDLLGRGYPPYRLPVSSMDTVSDRSTFADTVAAIKAALDPGNIIAPGRYSSATPRD
jgi:4-cresol dehydrogenase (hydroxylating) flavoprotein subunit